jgi:AAA family ATP:ADP antiporter
MSRSNASPHDAPPSLWRQFLQVRREERAPLALAFAYFFFVFASYYILRPIRDALGVAGGVDNLPWLFTGTLLATLLVTPLFSALVAKLPRRRFVAWAYRVLMLCLLGFWAALTGLSEEAQVWVGRGFFIWVSVFNLFVVSLFWAVMADCFRGDQAKRLFAMIAAGGTVGGLVGGAITRGLVDLLGTAALLLVSIALLEAGLRCMYALSRRVATASSEQAKADSEVIGGKLTAGYTSVLKSPYLLGVCGYMLLYTLGSTFLYFLQAEIVAGAFADRESRVAYFAQVDMLVNALTLFIQLGLAAHIVRRLGVGWTLALLPLVSIVGFTALGLAPVVFGVLVFQVARRTANFALARPAREMLYVPLSREDKYKAKNFIDVFVYRAGDQIGAWSSAAIGALGLGIAGLAWAAAPLSAVWLLLALWLGRRQATLQKTADDSAASVRTPPSTAASPS